MERGQKIEIPLRGHDHFAARQGVRKKTVQVNEREGRLFFGIVTDMGEVCAEQKLAYQPRCEEIALDYGLRTLFATDQGDLLGHIPPLPVLVVNKVRFVLPLDGTKFMGVIWYRPTPEV